MKGTALDSKPRAPSPASSFVLCFLRNTTLCSEVPVRIGREAVVFLLVLSLRCFIADFIVFVAFFSSDTVQSASLSFPVKTRRSRKPDGMQRFRYCRLCRYYCTSASRGIAATRLCCSCTPITINKPEILRDVGDEPLPLLRTGLPDFDVDKRAFLEHIGNELGVKEVTPSILLAKLKSERCQIGMGYRAMKYESREDISFSNATLRWKMFCETCFPNTNGILRDLRNIVAHRSAIGIIKTTSENG